MGRRTSIIFIFLLAVLFSCKKEIKEEPIEKKEEIKEEKKFKTYVIYYIDKESGLESPKTITLEEKENEIEDLKNLLQNYFSQKGNLLFPEGTNLRAIYPLNKNLVVDIYIPDGSPPLQSTGEEIEFVKALAKTVCLNFQRYKGINVLINGSDENKFINHIALYVSYKP
jgi:hypothetical protein